MKYECDECMSVCVSMREASPEDGVRLVFTSFHDGNIVCAYFLVAKLVHTMYACRLSVNKRAD